MKELIFLKQFKKLEKILKQISNKDDFTHFKDVLNNVENKHYLIESKKQIILDLYALRNIFSHKDRDRYIASINDLALKELNNIILLLKKPPKIGKVFKTKVYTAKPEDKLIDVINIMSKNLYTHIPVYDKNKYLGTFSENTLLFLFKENNLNLKNFTIANVNKKYLHSQNDKILFFPENKNVFEVKKEFENYIKNQKRLGAILITPKNDKNHFPPTGIITAYDLPRIDEYIK